MTTTLAERLSSQGCQTSLTLTLFSGLKVSRCPLVRGRAGAYLLVEEPFASPLDPAPLESVRLVLVLPKLPVLMMTSKETASGESYTWVLALLVLVCVTVFASSTS